MDFGLADVPMVDKHEATPAHEIGHIFTLADAGFLEENRKNLMLSGFDNTENQLGDKVMTRQGQEENQIKKSRDAARSLTQ